MSAESSDASPVGVLLHLARRARHAASASELGFIAVNETHILAPYRQAALWLADGGVKALSGVVVPESNAPFVQWLERIGRTLAAKNLQAPLTITADSLQPHDAAEWNEWLPAHGVWLPLSAVGSVTARGGLILAREQPWQVSEIQILAEWIDVWQHAWNSLHVAAAEKGWRRWFKSSGAKRLESGVPEPARDASQLGQGRSDVFTFVASLSRSIWRSRIKRYGVVLLACLFIPVRLTVLVPGELVPAQPAAIRAPLDGTVDRFFVVPNQIVKAGAPLFQLDLTTLSSKLNLSLQERATADAEYRQSAQQAVFDVRSKAQLATLEGRIYERRTEVEYLRAQLARARITAPRDGIALVDDPSEWIGKPVVTGEKVMTIADEHDVEVEAWLAPADMIDLPRSATVVLYLNAAPLDPVHARLRYAAHEAVARPDGNFAYRVRAVLEEGGLKPRVGLKGTARVSGKHVPLLYWMIRRPLAVIRPYIGL